MNNDNFNDNNIICGRNPVLEALRSGAPLDAVYICGNGGILGKIRAMARNSGAVVKDVDSRKLDQLTGGKSHQGVAASGACAEYVTVEDILQISVKKGTSPFIIICDEIEDPHNLGAIIRTAEAAGADGVIIPKRRSASLNATVFKTSAGAASWLPVARVSNLSAARRYPQEKRSMDLRHRRLRRKLRRRRSQRRHCSDYRLGRLRYGKTFKRKMRFPAQTAYARQNHVA